MTTREQTPRHRIGIDLGGTKIEGLLLDPWARVVQRTRIPTRQNEGYQAILGRISDLVGLLLERAENPARIGVCTPGSLSKQTGLVRNSNTLCLNGKPLQSDLQQAIGLPVAIENDANCFALAEARFGAGRGFDSIFGVILGTGVGGGIVIQRKLYRGHSFIAGEWGHHILYPGGHACYCGSRGCVETYLCGPALERRWLEMTGKSSTLPDIVRQSDSIEIDNPALQWKREVVRDFGIALSNVINIIDPEVVVLGGGVSNIPFLYDEGAVEVRRNIFSDVQETPVLRNELGDSSGVFGAACLNPASITSSLPAGRR